MGSEHNPSQSTKSAYCWRLNIEIQLVARECLVKAAFNCIYRMYRVREISSSIFVLTRLTSLVFSRGIVFSTGFALSADCQEFVGLLCGHSMSNQ